MMLRTTRSTCALTMAVCLFVLGGAIQAGADSVTLAWDASSGLVGYKVHVGVQSGSYTQHFDVGSSTSFTFPNATAGQRYCFAVSAYLLSSLLEGPNSGEVCGYSNQAPTLTNPGNRTSTVGQSVTLQLQGSDPDGQPVSYTASGLPPGLTLGASTGFIAGTGTTAGTYTVTARSYDGTLNSAAQTFTWTMTAPAGDTTRPTIALTAPTSGTSYSTSSQTMNLGGTASDNVGVTQVKWTNDRGGSGTATGTTNWSVTGVGLQSGTNVIVVTAFDAAGNSRSVSLTVTRSTTSADTTKPTATIGSPTSGTTFLTASSTINLTGSASDNVGVTQVKWASDRGGSGVATGTTSWAVASIGLYPGTNILTITAVDAAGNVGTDTLTVTYSGTTPPPTTPPPTDVTLSVSRGSSWRSVELDWKNATWSSVDVYRNGVRIKNTRNDGSTSDSVSRRGNYSYKICAPRSSTCSNTATIYVW